MFHEWVIGAPRKLNSSAIVNGEGRVEGGEMGDGSGGRLVGGRGGVGDQAL